MGLLATTSAEKAALSLQQAADFDDPRFLLWRRPSGIRQDLQETFIRNEFLLIDTANAAAHDLPYAREPLRAGQAVPFDLMVDEDGYQRSTYVRMPACLKE